MENDALKKKGVEFIREFGNLLRKYDIRNVRVSEDYDGDNCIKFTGVDLDIYAQFIDDDLLITEADILVQPKERNYEIVYFNAQDGRRMKNRREYLEES